MASMGIEAIKKFADSGEKPAPTEGMDFFDTGAVLVTDKPVDGRRVDRHRRTAWRSAGADRPEPV